MKWALLKQFIIIGSSKPQSEGENNLPPICGFSSNLLIWRISSIPFPSLPRHLSRAPGFNEGWYARTQHHPPPSCSQTQGFDRFDPIRPAPQGAANGARPTQGDTPSTWRFEN